MMDYMKIYNEWLEKATEDPQLVEELASIKDDNDAIYERFYTPLKFGTAGLRGVLGAGTNRMNIYVVRHATQGLSRSLTTPVSIPISLRSKLLAFWRQTASKHIFPKNSNPLPYSAT